MPQKTSSPVPSHSNPGIPKKYWQIWSKAEFIYQLDAARDLDQWQPFALGTQIDGGILLDVQLRRTLEEPFGVSIKDTGVSATSVLTPKMDQYVFQHYERTLYRYNYVSELYPDWAWLTSSLFQTLDTMRPKLNGEKGFGGLPGHATPQ